MLGNHSFSTILDNSNHTPLQGSLSYMHPNTTLLQGSLSYMHPNTTREDLSLISNTEFSSSTELSSTAHSLVQLRSITLPPHPLQNRA